MFKLLDNGKLDDSDTKSEYERGWIDCWNKFFIPANDWEIRYYHEKFYRDNL